jgi:transcriptional regulator with XRE-family HTH domain
VNTLDYQHVLGRKIARERRRHGLSQPQLAAIVNRPVAWVSQLERGTQPLDGALPLKTIAEALELPLSELAASAPVQRIEQRRTPAADRLRLLLAGAYSLCAMLGESRAPALGSLRTTTDRACALAASGDYDQLAAVLGDLLPGLEAAGRTVPAALQSDTYELTAMAYQACSTALMKLGEPLAAWVAADRAMAAAEKAGNLLLAAAGQYRLASVFLDAHEHALADEMARTTLLALRGLAELGDPDALSLCGGLTLLCALISARTNHPAAAYGHLAKARLLASRLGSRRPDGMPEFSAQYVALVEIAISVDLGDTGHALRAAASVDMASFTPGQLAQMLIDVARAYAMREQVDEATAALLRAADFGPGQVHDRERACHLIRDLLTMRNSPRRALLALAERMEGAPA